MMCQPIKIICVRTLYKLGYFWVNTGKEIQIFGGVNIDKEIQIFLKEHLQFQTRWWLCWTSTVRLVK